jgi:UDP-N-acetylmuramoyl-L-alanyl-D-glutamate--2,6-diaminopimelate ligase
VARRHPLRGRLRVVCVTGTNGKTTTTSMIDAIVRTAGHVSARVTTLGGFVGDVPVARGTAREVFEATVRAAVAREAPILAVETTSKALGRGFARGFPPDVAVFTNLTRDHLDLHETPEHYLAAKAQLFAALSPGGVAVLNASDPASALLAETVPSHARCAWFAGRARTADGEIALAAADVVPRRDGTVVALGPGPLAARLGGEIRLAVVGDVHAENALAAALAADALGIDAAAIHEGLETFRGVPGRFEIVASAPLVAVDYAHTPDALERTLRLARTLAGDACVSVVFGCGGDRDAGKRPEMGRIADALADEVVLTNDNPRSEPPEVIADAVESGAPAPRRARWSRILDRAGAIELAIARASDGDVVVIAGKGHETGQEIAGRIDPFSDVDIARAVCERPRAFSRR